MVINTSWWNRTYQNGAPMYSDHKPIICHNMLSWNIMNQCRSNSSRTNNGYGYSETTPEYQDRLQRITDKIAKLIEENNIDIINLQEVPLSKENFAFFRDILRDKLGDKFFIGYEFLHKTDGTESACFTIFNKEKYFGENVTTAHESNLGEQQGRVLFSQLTDRITKEKFVIANGHFASRKNHLHAISYLNSNGINFAIDLNTNSATVLNDCTPLFFNSDGENFSFNTRTHKQNPITKYDAISIYTASLLRRDLYEDEQESYQQIPGDDTVPYQPEKSIVENILTAAQLKENILASMILSDTEDLVKEIYRNPSYLYNIYGERYLDMVQMSQSYPSPSPSPSYSAQTHQMMQTPSSELTTRFKESRETELVSANIWQSFIQAILPTKMARNFLSFQPAASHTQMAEFHFSCKNSATAFLDFLKQKKIITNANKQIYFNRSSDSMTDYFSIALGSGELHRLDEYRNRQEVDSTSRKRRKHR